MNARRNLMSIIWAMAGLSLLGGLTACGSEKQPIDPNPVSDPRLEIPWPPEAVPTRTVSDDEITFLGNQFSMSEGSVEVTPPDTDVTFSPAEPWTFAIYSLTGFVNDIIPASIVVNYTVDDPVESEGSTQLYFGISNYTIGGWQWYLGDPDSPEIVFPIATRDGYPSVNGDLHIAVVHQGEGTANLSSIIVRREGNTLLFPPENLEAFPEVLEILLTWDASPGASGYNVYRNREKADDEYELLNPAPITETTFLDVTVLRNWIYYYRVTAVGSNESEMGERVDIYSPMEDLYLPLNYQISDRGTDFFRITWDWEGEDPDAWVLFLKEEDDFDLLDPIHEVNLFIPFVRTYKFYDLVPGKTYYWRICAKVSGRRGKMTDDLPGTTEGLWTWEPVEEIGPGNSPLTVLTVDNDLSVAYINGVAGDFARRSGGTWNTETVLTTMAGSGGAIATIDMAYGGGKYAIGGLDGSPGDAILTTGNPGSWEQLRIDGNGDPGPGHANSGDNLKVAANDSNFLVVHHDDTFEVHYQMTAIDTISWSSKTTLWPFYNGDSQYSLASTADNFYLLWYRREVGNEGLEFYSYDDAAWNMVEVFPDGPSEIGHYNDLTMSSTGEWFSTAYDPAAFEMHFIHESDSTWTSVLAEGSDRQGDKANLVAVGDRMFSVFKNRDKGIWMMAIYDSGVWEVSPLSVPGAKIKRAKLAAIGDIPYIVFHDEDGDDMIKCAPGTAPPPV